MLNWPLLRKAIGYISAVRERPIQILPNHWFVFRQLCMNDKSTSVCGLTPGQTMQSAESCPSTLADKLCASNRGDVLARGLVASFSFSKVWEQTPYGFKKLVYRKTYYPSSMLSVVTKSLLPPTKIQRAAERVRYGFSAC